MPGCMVEKGALVHGGLVEGSGWREWVVGRGALVEGDLVEGGFEEGNIWKDWMEERGGWWTFCDVVVGVWTRKRFWRFGSAEVAEVEE
jgi:hypothetical protein